MPDRKQLNRGGYSTVYRQGQSDYLIKKPNTDLTQKERQATVYGYLKQKRILDYLHQHNPRKSHLFNEIYQVKGDQMKMKDLGDTDLFMVLKNRELYQLLLLDFDNVFKQLMDGFATLINSGVVHRDLKIENIMARYVDGHFKISFVDFADALHISQIDQPFKLIGTKKYMSPELLRRVKTSNKEKGTFQEYVANDLWSLGMVLYILLYGNYPYEMFKQKHPSLVGIISSPDVLYDSYWNQRFDLFHDLFPSVLGKNNKYIDDIKALLSPSQRTRVQWLKKYKQRKQKQQQKQASR